MGHWLASRCTCLTALPFPRYTSYMQSLDKATNGSAFMEQSAELVMETVSMVTRAIKREMREHRPMEMSMQQFRAMGMIDRHPGESLSFVAAHLGLTDATASKLIEALVKPGLITRAEAADDRRKVVISITKSGRRALESARKAALGRIASVLARLDEQDRSAVIRAMNVLRESLHGTPDAEAAGKAGSI
jgi:DNA-binding MarR family transcriptional regulator